MGGPCQLAINSDRPLDQKEKRGTFVYIVTSAIRTPRRVESLRRAHQKDPLVTRLLRRFLWRPTNIGRPRFKLTKRHSGKVFQKFQLFRLIFATAKPLIGVHRASIIKPTLATRNGSFGTLSFDNRMTAAGRSRNYVSCVYTSSAYNTPS
jgi:hypothetical protein